MLGFESVGFVLSRSLSAFDNAVMQSTYIINWRKVDLVSERILLINPSTPILGCSESLLHVGQAGLVRHHQDGNNLEPRCVIGDSV